MMGLVTGGLETKGELTAEVHGDDASARRTKSQALLEPIRVWQM
jgi:hypothetical protein